MYTPLGRPKNSKTRMEKSVKHAFRSSTNSFVLPCLGISDIFLYFMSILIIYLVVLENNSIYYVRENTYTTC